MIFGAISFAVIALIFIYANRIMNDLNVSEKRLNKAKSDYQYVVSKAELLNSKLINTSADINQIEAYITDLFSNSTKDLKVENSNEFDAPASIISPRHHDPEAGCFVCFRKNDG